MRSFGVPSAFVVVFFGLLGNLSAQRPQSLPSTAVPRLVRVGSTFHPANGQPSEPVEGVTLSIYRDEHDGAPLWQEVQNVSVDSEGRYSVLLGATFNEGLPLELFTSGEPRWLGVRFNRPGEVEQPRTLLTSVPYALRASDAETLGGLPASAYLRDPSASSSSSGEAPAATAAAVIASATLTPNAPKPRVTSGAAGFIGVFTDATDLGDSPMYQNYGTRIGLNTTLPYDYFHVQFNDSSGVFTGIAVQNINAAGFSGMQFYDQNGALAQFQGFGNTTHEYRINNIASGGTINFLIGSASKFKVANNGNIGISNSTPAYALDVGGDVNSSGVIRFGGTTVLQAPGGVGPGVTGVGLNALASNTTGGHNTALGTSALGATTTGSANTAVGYFALGANNTGAGNTSIGGLSLSSNTTGSSNTAAGQWALLGNTTGNNNTAVGQAAMTANTTGCCNVAMGQAALSSNTTGNANVALGGSALQNSTTGGNNTAVGQAAMLANTTGCCNAAVGQAALNSNTTGNGNAALGGSALQNNTSGGGNTAVGQGALSANITGSSNTAAGQAALFSNTTGVNNTAVGVNALFSDTTGNGNTGIGYGALNATTGYQNTAVGLNALVNNTSGTVNIAIGAGAANAVGGGNSNNIHIGSPGAAGDSGTIRIGNPGTQTSFYVAGVSGANLGSDMNAVPVVIDTTSGLMGVTSSSRRYKEDIQDMGAASGGLMRLRPVTFRYEKPAPDGSKPMQYGLIAEEVAEVYPDLVARSADGQIETVRYQVLDSMLLNEVQRQQTEIGSQREEIRLLQERLAKLESALAAISGGTKIP